MKDKDFSNNLNQNLITENNQFQTAEVFENDNINQISNNSEPPPVNNFIPLEISSPLEKTPINYQAQNISLPQSKDINGPAPLMSLPQA